MMVIRMHSSIIMLITASGFFMSFRIPSLKKERLSLMTSCWRFSSSLAFSNFVRSICALRICFLGMLPES